VDEFAQVRLLPVEGEEFQYEPEVYLTWLESTMLLGTQSPAWGLTFPRTAWMLDQLRVSLLVQIHHHYPRLHQDHRNPSHRHHFEVGL
jgi:hypothetical protein